MPAYVNKYGKVEQDAPLTYKVKEFLLSLWLGLTLFISTLFNPNQTHKLDPSTSLKARRNNYGGYGGGAGGGGGGGNGPGGRGGRGGMSDFNGKVLPSDSDSI
ncbi:hypothetical protein MNV49_002021 [Pseudohyphozyma bogoriensis]|nr:hypothetical protein MNV49_002021 [Pseudohyphozyma bogoriensis]